MIDYFTVTDSRGSYTVPALIYRSRLTARCNQRYELGGNIVMPNAAITVGWLALSFLWSAGTGVVLALIPISETQPIASSEPWFTGISLLAAILLTLAAQWATRVRPWPLGTWLLLMAAGGVWMVYVFLPSILALSIAWLITGGWIWFGTSQHCVKTIPPQRTFALMAVLPILGLSTGCALGWFLWLQVVRSFNVM